MVWASDAADCVSAAVVCVVAVLPRHPVMDIAAIAAAKTTANFLFITFPPLHVLHVFASVLVLQDDVIMYSPTCQ